MFAHHRPEMLLPSERGASAGNVVNSKANNVAPIDMIYTLNPTVPPRAFDFTNKLRALQFLQVNLLKNGIILFKKRT